jgi:hypothetical protein
MMLFAAAGPCQAQSSGSVEALSGRIYAGDVNFYLLPNLTKGDTFYAYARGTSGNFDPFLTLTNMSLNASSLVEDFTAEVEKDVINEQGLIISISEAADKYFPVWDDDIGRGYDAALQFNIPVNGDYRLSISSSPGRRTFGDYFLIVGINSPQVLTGQADATGQHIAFLEKNASKSEYGVEEFNGTLTAAKYSTYYVLDPVAAGDTFYAYIQAVSDDLIPQLFLTDYGNKTLRTANYAGLMNSGTLNYTFSENSINNRLIIASGKKNGNITTGDYRLITGINAPDVLLGRANVTARTVLQEPNPVKVGFQLDHITGVNQIAGSFDIVGSIWMQWTDPALAFSPDSCNCSLKTYRDVNQFVSTEESIWPEFTIANQQGKRETQNQIIAVEPNGEVTYFERFWVSMQEPNFDFRKYPLDKQDFHIQINSIYPEELYTYINWDEKNILGNDLGVSDWIINEYDTSVNNSRIANVNPQFTFLFQGQRQLTYYFLRIFIPIFIIILISWLTFFLKDYIKRSDIAAANLLLFIAFNFAIASDLPRLGYATLLDWVMLFAFVFTSLIFAYNLYLRLLETREEHALAERVDKVMIWLYPVMYLIAFILIPLIIYDLK